MIHLQAGEIAPGFHVLGTMAIPVFLLDGIEPILFDAGVSAFGPLYVQHAKQVLGSRSPKRLFISHVHFDHCGAAAYLAQTFPELKIFASDRAAAIVARPNAQKLIAHLNEQASELVHTLEPNLASQVPFAPFTVDGLLSDGDQLELQDGQVLQVLATPGHTWDMLSFYLPGRKMLMASEAVGCPTQDGHIITEFLVDYEAYLSSLKRLANLPIDTLCLAHHSVLTGPDASGYFGRALAAAEEFKEWVEDLLHQEGLDVARVVQIVKSREWDPRPQPKQPEPAYLLNLQARVEHLAEKLIGQP